MYVDKRYAKIKDRISPVSTMVGMALRIGILALVLCCGKFFCDKAVEVSHNTVSEHSLKLYTKSKLRVLVKLKTEGLISEEELKQKVRELENNTKEMYLKEYR